MFTPPSPKRNMDNLLSLVSTHKYRSTSSIEMNCRKVFVHDGVCYMYLYTFLILLNAKKKFNNLTTITLISTRSPVLMCNGLI